MGNKKKYFIDHNKGYYQVAANPDPKQIKWGHYFLYKKPGSDGKVCYCTDDKREMHNGLSIRSGNRLYTEKYCKLLEPVIEPVIEPVEGLKTFIWYSNVNNAPGLLVATAETEEEAKETIIKRSKFLGNKRVDEITLSLKYRQPIILNPGTAFIYEQ
jgi:hypothetical protein